MLHPTKLLPFRLLELSHDELIGRIYEFRRARKVRTSKLRKATDMLDDLGNEEREKVLAALKENM